ncbi:hypothetical protein [Lelliottia nimipressuralis]|uniref:hypothetical protein n=1 Tax=Lelliottia nimipressuralis TaxID=69220 RepID=UPI001E54DFD2|nr:hypothetical protein [Lelliottia nimipressuralis]MCD4562238.1 hypothetical protein [Lelliottia nimipressuralis]
MHDTTNRTCSCNGTTCALASQEVDLIHLISILWQKRRRILLGIGMGIIIGLVASGLRSVERSSEARIIPPLFRELQAQQEVQEQLAGMNIAFPFGSDTWFILFIQAYDSSVLQQAWQEQSPFARQQIRFMRQSSEGDKKREYSGYRYEILTLTADATIDTQQALKDYMAFVNREVNRDIEFRIKQLVRQQLASKEHQVGVSLPSIPSFYVQPYREHEAPSVAASTSRRTGLAATLGGVLGGLVLSMFIIADDAFRKEILSRRPAEYR